MITDEDEKVLDGIRAKDLFGNLIVRWDGLHQTLTDLGGFPLTRTEAKALRSLINQHLKKSASELSDVAREWIREESPNMEGYANLSPERFE